jgi:hypothetical protein
MPILFLRMSLGYITKVLYNYTRDGLWPLLTMSLKYIAEVLHSTTLRETIMAILKDVTLRYINKVLYNSTRDDSRHS